MPIREDVSIPQLVRTTRRGGAMPFGDYEDFEDCVRKNQDKEESD